MSSPNPIGGYFELELDSKGSFVHDDAVLLNSGRNCFEFILRAAKPSRVHMPKYTCDVMLEPLERLKISYSFYQINENLEIQTSLEPRGGELVLYTNYFGIKTEYCRQLSEKFQKNLVLDYSQAFFDEPLKNIHTFYSPRKFFGLPDGGMLYTDLNLPDDFPLDSSWEHFEHLIKRLDLGAEAGYEAFKRDDQALSGQPIKRMSNVTRRLLGSIDFSKAVQKRMENFKTLHQNLAPTNALAIGAEKLNAPMCYPYRTSDQTLRQKLIDSKIFVATYWPNVFEWCEETETEYRFAQSILPLPIDQRYSVDDMQYIVNIIRGVI